MSDISSHVTYQNDLLEDVWGCNLQQWIHAHLWVRVLSGQLSQNVNKLVGHNNVTYSYHYISTPSLLLIENCKMIIQSQLMLEYLNLNAAALLTGSQFFLARTYTVFISHIKFYKQFEKHIFGKWFEQTFEKSPS